jgi:two-component system OmpR family sensor kinase
MLPARQRWTLRRRLVLGIVALLAFVSIVIGTVSVLALQSSLTQKVDTQVSSAIGRAQEAFNRLDDPQFPNFQGEGDQGGADGILLVGGVPPGSVVATQKDGVTSGGQQGQTFLAATLLSDGQTEALLAVAPGSQPATVSLDGLGQFRVVAVQSTGGDIIVVGFSLEETNATVRQVLLVIVIVTLAGLAAAFFAGTAIVRLALRPLERVTATASHVSELPLDRGDVAIEARVPEEDADPRTEVGQVGAAINRMLGHVASALNARESSEKKLRSFVADASHELRTPLASIRGYAELTRRGGHDLPDDVVHALGRVESESVRMTSLVEDLLLLARLDDGRELEKNPVDLTRILADALSDAHAVSQNHEWVLDVPEEPVVVTGDAPRLHQVVVNLLANARVHTPAGTRVVVSATCLGDAVQIAVRDNGPGIDPKVLPAVFERFARGDSSRSRVAGSTGLGLAIVSAVVDAHGGTVGVESVPGDTVFTVTLPR